MASDSLTAALIRDHKEAFLAATQHPFLAQAGAGTLPSELLTSWLVQDKYYQFAYVKFIGRLIAKLDLSSYAFAAIESKDSDTNIEWRTLQALVGALNAIKTEIEFYDDTVAKYSLRLENESPNEVTKQYVQLFEDSTASDKPIIQGLTVLWATEFCYLNAWTFAKEQSSGKAAVAGGEGAVAALHKEFIPNWTSDGFGGAVKELADVADSWAGRSSGSEIEECEKFWLKTLDLEAKFWPST